MSSRPRAGFVPANNTSGLPGIRARWRHPKLGGPQLGLDVAWTVRGERRFTTFPATADGMARAMRLRRKRGHFVPQISAERAVRRAIAAAGRP
mgnify:CR=1 FL=1